MQMSMQAMGIAASTSSTFAGGRAPIFLPFPLMYTLVDVPLAAGQNAANFPPMFGGCGRGSNPTMMQAFFRSVFTSALGLPSRASDYP
jgi:hypothetical protein